MYKDSDKYYSLHYEFETFNYFKKTIKALKKKIDFNNKEVLEIGSGTGFYPIEYAKLNAKVSCIDKSDNFIRIFTDKLIKQPHLREKIKINKCDFTSFNLENKFDLIFMIGNTFIYNLNKNSQISCLKSIYSHLKNEGRAYIHFWNLGKRLSESFKVNRNFYNSLIDVQINEKATMKVDFVCHEITYYISYKYLSGKYKGKIVKEKMRTRMLFPTEFELLLDLVGLKIRNVYCDYLSTRIKKNIFEYYYEVSK